MKTFTLVILTKNEIEGVRALIPLLPREQLAEILAADGGSTDGTREFFQEQGISILEQTTPGRGEAMRMAAQQAKGEVLIFYSPDGNEDPKDIIRMQELFQAADAPDLVIASRMMRGAWNEEDGSWFRPRKWANLFFGWMANAKWNRSGLFVMDTINGFRGISKNLFNDLRLDAKGFTIEYQMTIRAFKRSLKIAEFPTREGERIGRQTGAKAIPTGIAFLRCFWNEWMKPSKPE